MTWRCILPSVLIMFIASLNYQVPAAIADHENMAILRDQSGPRIYVEGDDITTKVKVSAGNFSSGHKITSQNETAYYLTIIDTSNTGLTMPTYNRAIFVESMNEIVHPYVRQLPQGYWIIRIELRDGNGPDGRLLHTDEDRIIVKGAEFSIIERQAEAATKSAQVAEENLQKGPIVTATAAIVGAAVAAAGTFAVHRYLDQQRDKRDSEREDNFRDSIRTLVRLELTSYRDFINRIISADVTLGERKEVFLVRPEDQELREHADRILPTEGRIANPRNYLSLAPETKARAFGPEQIRMLEETYGELQKFRTRNLNPGGSNYEFNRDVITSLRQRLDAAIGTLVNTVASSEPSPSGILSSDRSSQDNEHRFQIQLARIQIDLGSIFGFGIALVTASIGVLVAIITIGKIESIDRLQQLGSLLYLLLAIMGLGLALLFIGGYYGKKRLRSLENGEP